MSNSSTAAYSPSAYFDGTWSATPLTIVICSAITGYNAIEGLILILVTFRQYKGLYFWALIVAALGIVLYMIALILWYFAITKLIGALVILYIGWICMVTGQSVVLYSRLGIVMGPEREGIVRGVKWMIIVDALVFHTLTIVVSVCSFYVPDREAAGRVYYYVERLQITAFGVQELIISGVYIWRTLDILRTSVRPHTRRIVLELLMINLILVIIDTSTITLEYCNLFFFEVAFKMVSYSVKLKLEFAILSKLMQLSGSDDTARDSTGGSLVFPMDTESTAVDVHRTPSSALAHQDLSFQGEKRQVDIIDTGDTTTMDRYRNRSAAFDQRKDSLESYADVMRALSKG